MREGDRWTDRQTDTGEILRGDTWPTFLNYCLMLEGILGGILISLLLEFFVQ